MSRELTLAIAFAALGIGFGVGSLYKEHKFVAQWETFFDLPVGEFGYLERPPAIIQKTAVRTLAYRPMPTSDDVKAVKLFPPVPQVETPVTTTLPEKKRGKR